MVIKMKKMFIFEPAMCCETGICGVGVDTELLRISTVINNLKRNGFDVARYNLSSTPNEFVKNKLINEMINKDGVSILPITMVDDKVMKTGTYPTNEEFVAWLEVSEQILDETKEDNEDSCCGGGCCC